MENEMTYLELISSHLRRFGADAVLIALVEDYLENDHPTNEPPWRSGHDSIILKAIEYGKSKRFRLNRFQSRFNGRYHKHVLRDGESAKEAKQQMIERFKTLERLVRRPSGACPLSKYSRQQFHGLKTHFRGHKGT
jgi:hypothetical protein